MEISGFALIRMFMDHPMQEVTSTMPEDVRVLDIKFDHLKGTASLILESPSFEEVPDGAYPPMFAPTFAVRVPDPYLDGLLKPCACP